MSAFTLSRSASQTLRIALRSSLAGADDPVTLIRCARNLIDVPAYSAELGNRALQRNQFFLG
jgi:hypothetical protein